MANGLLAESDINPRPDQVNESAPAPDAPPCDDVVRSAIDKYAAGKLANIGIKKAREIMSTAIVLASKGELPYGLTPDEVLFMWLSTAHWAELRRLFVSTMGREPQISVQTLSNLETIRTSTSENTRQRIYAILKALFTVTVLPLIVSEQRALDCKPEQFKKQFTASTGVLDIAPNDCNGMRVAYRVDKQVVFEADVSIGSVHILELDHERARKMVEAPHNLIALATMAYRAFFTLIAESGRPS